MEKPLQNLQNQTETLPKHWASARERHTSHQWQQATPLSPTLVGWWGLVERDLGRLGVGFFRMKKVWDLVFPWLNWDSLFLFSLFCFRRDVRSIHVYSPKIDRQSCKSTCRHTISKQRDCQKFILVRDVGDCLGTVRLTQWKVKMNKGPAIRNLDENDYILVVIWQFASWDPDTPKNIHKSTTMEMSLWKKIHKSPDLNLKCCCPPT